MFVSGPGPRDSVAALCGEGVSSEQVTLHNGCGILRLGVCKGQCVLMVSLAVRTVIVATGLRVHSGLLRVCVHGPEGGALSCDRSCANHERLLII